MTTDDRQPATDDQAAARFPTWRMAPARILAVVAGGVLCSFGLRWLARLLIRAALWLVGPSSADGEL